MAGPAEQRALRAKASSQIEEWCNESGTTPFLEHLLKLLDEQHLKTWGGLSHISFPKRSQLGPTGKVPNRHWRYRFYHGCAAVLGWRERVSHGDPRYFNEELHTTLKELWPDEPEVAQQKPRRSVNSIRTSSEDSSSRTEVTLRADSSSTITCVVKTDSRDNKTRRSPSPQSSVRRRRLPNWAYISITNLPEQPQSDPDNDGFYSE
ncbi:hypothetical protein R1sor_018388 [Riccia sorocarpa]|uniref:Uncharacterized protein n=1 Tax=Riccia sorocarpa TaxID=122646 RepID=A0ABD3IAK3_9MARC